MDSLIHWLFDHFVPHQRNKHVPHLLSERALVATFLLLLLSEVWLFIGGSFVEVTFLLTMTLVLVGISLVVLFASFHKKHKPILFLRGFVLVCALAGVIVWNDSLIRAIGAVSPTQTNNRAPYEL